MRYVMQRSYRCALQYSLMRITHFTLYLNAKFKKNIYRVINKYFSILIFISNIINVPPQTLCIIKGLMTEIDCNIVNVILEPSMEFNLASQYELGMFRICDTMYIFRL